MESAVCADLDKHPLRGEHQVGLLLLLLLLVVKRQLGRNFAAVAFDKLPSSPLRSATRSSGE